MTFLRAVSHSQSFLSVLLDTYTVSNKELVTKIDLNYVRLHVNNTFSRDVIFPNTN